MLHIPGLVFHRAGTTDCNYKYMYASDLGRLGVAGQGRQEEHWIKASGHLGRNSPTETHSQEGAIGTWD